MKRAIVVLALVLAAGCIPESVKQGTLYTQEVLIKVQAEGAAPADPLVTDACKVGAAVCEYVGPPRQSVPLTPEGADYIVKGIGEAIYRLQFWRKKIQGGLIGIAKVFGYGGWAAAVFAAWSALKKKGVINTMMGAAERFKDNIMKMRNVAAEGSADGEMSREDYLALFDALRKGVNPTIEAAAILRGNLKEVRAAYESAKNTFEQAEK